MDHASSSSSSWIYIHTQHSTRIAFMPLLMLLPPPPPPSLTPLFIYIIAPNHAQSYLSRAVMPNSPNTAVRNALAVKDSGAYTRLLGCVNIHTCHHHHNVSTRMAIIVKSG